MTSYIGFRQDRQRLGYSCQKDIEAGKSLRLRLRAKKSKSKKSFKKKFRNLTAAGIFGYSIFFATRISANDNSFGREHTVVQPAQERVVPTAMEADALLPASVEEVFWLTCKAFIKSTSGNSTVIYS